MPSPQRRIYRINININNYHSMDSILKKINDTKKPAIKQNDPVSKGCSIENIGKYYDIESVEYVHSKPIPFIYLKEYNETKEIDAYFQ